MNKRINYELDLKRTLIANFHNLILIPIYCYFSYMMLNMSSKMPETSLQILGLMISVYGITKLFSTLNWSFQMKEYFETKIVFKIGDKIKNVKL